MGKRKRSRKYDDDHILRKLKKLEDILKDKRRERDKSSESEPDMHQESTEDHREPDELISDNVPTVSNAEDGDLIVSEDCVDLTNPTAEEAMECIAKNNVNEIDPEVLLLLGEDPLTLRIQGDDINEHIATRWQHILLNGLTKEVKSDILKQYLVPTNCNNLQAPKLNAEMKAAITDTNLKKDFFSESKQNQLSGSLIAMAQSINKAIELNLSQDILKPLSDAGRLLCDYHFRESQSRRFAIMNTLNKETRDAVKDSKIDGFLFGSNLAEHLKSARAISKTGSEMRTTATSRPPYRTAANVTQRGALNARGASRPMATETRQAPYNTARPAPYTTARRRPAQAALPPPRQPSSRGRQRDTANYRNYNRPRFQQQR